MELGTAFREIADDLHTELAWNPGLGWLHWNGKVWNEVADSQALGQVNGYRDERGDRPWTARQANQLRGALETGADGLDAHLDLLNVQNGVVSLRTGELRPHDPALRLTKITAVDYSPEARSDVWDRILSAIPASERIRLRVQLSEAVAGRPTDGVTLVHGPGASGKSTLVQAVRSALGTYAMTMDSATLGLRSPFDAVNLRGTRLLVMDGAGPDDMDRVKRLVSTDEFISRRIRRDPITFAASHSMLLTTNRQPSDLATDEGARRRLRPVGLQTLSEADPTLRRLAREPETMRAVLRWIVEGAVRGYASR